MNLLPLDNPQNIELCSELGAALALYETTDRVEESKGRIQVLMEKQISPDLKEQLAAIQSLMSRNVPINIETFKSDLETERHYTALFAKKVQENAKELEDLRARRDVHRGQLTALQNSAKK